VVRPGSQVTIFQQIGVYVPVQGASVAYTACAPPGLPDAEEGDPVTGVLEPTLHFGPHVGREIPAFAPDDPFGGPLLDVGCSGHGDSCASADNSRIVREDILRLHSAPAGGRGAEAPVRNLLLHPIP